MTHRSEERIIYDLLKTVHSWNVPMPIRIMFESAKLGRKTQLKYLDILKDQGFVFASGDFPKRDTVRISQKGIQYILCFESLMHLLGEAPNWRELLNA